MGEPTMRVAALLDDLVSIDTAQADITLVTTDDVYAVVTIDTAARGDLIDLAAKHGLTLESVNRYACYLGDGTDTAEGSLEVVTLDEPTSPDTAIATARLLLATESELTDSLTAQGHTWTGSVLAALVEHAPQTAETLGVSLMETILTLLLDGDYGSSLTAASPLEATLATLITDTAVIDPWHPPNAYAAAETLMRIAPLIDTARALTR